MWDDVALYAGFGALAGVVSGLFGVGGGIVIVPFLAWLLPRRGFPDDLVMLVAVATSLATIIVTSVSAVAAHHRKGAVRWPVVWRFAPGVLLGAAAGTLLAERLPVPLFKLMFALFLFIVAARMYRGTRGNHAAARSSPMSRFAASCMIGAVSAILGIGGGTLSVPYLTRGGMPVHYAVAISNALGFPLAVAGTISYVLLGGRRDDIPDPHIGYVYGPAFVGIILTSIAFAPLGAHLAHRLPTRTLRRGFALLLAIVGVRLLAQAMRAFAVHPPLWHP